MPSRAVAKRSNAEYCRPYSSVRQAHEQEAQMTTSRVCTMLSRLRPPPPVSFVARSRGLAFSTTSALWQDPPGRILTEREDRPQLDKAPDQQKRPNHNSKSKHRYKPHRQHRESSFESKADGIFLKGLLVGIQTFPRCRKSQRRQYNSSSRKTRASLQRPRSLPPDTLPILDPRQRCPRVVYRHDRAAYQTSKGVVLRPQDQHANGGDR